jgi:II/X family phage/plasmid replication protein
MIDWITALVPFPHTVPINSGNVVSVSSTGELDWSVEKRLEVVGSYDSRIQIKSIHKDTLCSHLQIHGNPIKFLQGHNVWGTDDLHGLLTEILIRILSVLGFEVSPYFLARAAYNSQLSRIDLTQMFDLGTLDRVQAYIRAAGFNANLQYRGRGIFTGDTLYFGKGSRRWALKMYAKGSELKAHRSRCVDSPTYLDAVTTFANRALRVELVLRSLELADMGFVSVSSWQEQTSDLLYSGYLSKLQFSDNMTVAFSDERIKNLPSRLKIAYQEWSEGYDLREIYKRPTFYRYRKELLEKLNIDIGIRLDVKPDLKSFDNVIPLRIVLEAKPMQVPDWAKGTPLYFEPRVNFL